MKVSFVIPIFNNFPLINQLMVDIKDHSFPDEIVVVDDCSVDKQTLDGLAWWAENFNIKVFRPLENLGFLRASNYGVSKATGEAVCLISSDVRVEDNLARIVKDLLEANEKQLIGGVLYSHGTGWNEFESGFGGKHIFSYLEGWLLCCLKSTWEDLGGFDERYCPNDFEDVDISTTALSKGYSLTPLNNPKIRHLGGGTIGYGDERQALTIRNKEKFREKWIDKK